ncbi:unnamed protein product [Prorocentrum cordatum]|uniref:Uncharacterized protein n=1 Tax=Prorocentrum cordatum TaxID=2364126 RepID=A0ABN9VCI4_9DINO|nr:unnamed protein product [Polarella glacialis]
MKVTFSLQEFWNMGEPAGQLANREGSVAYNLLKNCVGNASEKMERMTDQTGAPKSNLISIAQIKDKFEFLLESASRALAAYEKADVDAIVEEAKAVQTKLLSIVSFGDSEKGWKAKVDPEAPWPDVEAALRKTVFSTKGLASKVASNTDSMKKAIQSVKDALNSYGMDPATTAIEDMEKTIALANTVRMEACTAQAIREHADSDKAAKTMAMTNVLDLFPEHGVQQNQLHRAMQQEIVEYMRGGAGRVDIVRLLPPHLQSALESGHGLLRSEQEATAALEEADVTCYVDGKLAQRGIDYGRFLLELYDAGIVEALGYELERKEETGVYFAPRKDDKLRLIFDTRRANCHFRTPEYTHLASGDALSSLECTPGEEVHLAAGDVEVCFYQYVLPAWARNYFCLPSLATRMLPARLREALGPELAARPRIAFRVRVVPMGWNWAVHFVQSAHLNVLVSVSPSNQWLVDKQPGACLSDSSAAAKVVNDMLDSFTSEGVRASLDLDVVLLGFTLDSKAARWRPAPEKFWRVHGCISHLLEPGWRITGRQLERLAGHVVALLLLRREALSLLSAVYVFIRSTYDRAQPLWPSCRRELRWVLALLPTVFADMKRPWHSEVGAFDASPWGAGVCTARWPLSAVQAAGRQPEKLRFRGPLASLVAPRDSALAADSVELSDPAALLLGRAAGFAEVSAELLREATCATAVACKWRRQSTIHRLESSAGLLWLRRASRNSRCHGHRLLSLGDNMSMICAHEKGRASDFGLLSGCRCSFAISVACNLKERGFLAANKVRPSTRVLYLKVLRLLAGWLMVDALPDWPVAAWDAALTDFLPWAFDQGVARATAARLGAAVLWGPPQLRVAPLQRCFPQLAHSLAGWKRLHPPGSRPPLPELVVRAAAAWLAHQGEFATALCVMLMFEGYLRPSEALALRAAQLTGPFGSATSAGSHMSVVVHAAELQQPGKTGEMDHTVVLDLPRQQALAWALARLRDSRLGSWHPLWDFDYSLLLRRFGQALEAVGASCLAGTLYSLRHGGASHDRLTGSRALREAQQRGNLRAFNSSRRYDKHGRVAIEWMKIPAHQRQEIERLAAGLDAACKQCSPQL